MYDWHFFILMNLHMRILPPQRYRHILRIDQITKVTSTDFDAIQNGREVTNGHVI